MMKHVDRIEFEDRSRIYGYQAGYCKDTDCYLLKKQSGWVYDYGMYYRITETEYEEISSRIKDFDSLKLYLNNTMPDLSDRYVGAGHIRGYDVAPFKCDCKDLPFLYRDGPFLCEDGVFYYHLFWDGRHYAAVPRVWALKKRPDGSWTRNGIYRDMDDISLIKIKHGDKEIELCYGKEIFEFDGIEEWNLLKEAALNTEV